MIATVAHMVHHADFWRGARSLDRRVGPHHEWLHFCVLLPACTLVVNISVSHDASGDARARLTMLAHRDGKWHGEVDSFDAGDVHAAPGRIRLQLGRNRLDFTDGAFRLDVALADRSLAASLRFVPQTMPALSANLPMSARGTLHWLTVPRLSAHGSILIGDDRCVVEGAPAYHDHNWGHFAFGDDFAWDWGFVLPRTATQPWSLVFARLGDRARTTAWTQSLFLWRDARHARVLRDEAIRLRDHGLKRPPRLFKLPRVMGLLSAGSTTDVPAKMTLHAQQGADWLQADFDAGDVAQVIVPNDRDLGVTAINEVVADVVLRGSIRGEDIEMDGHGVFERLGT